MRENSYEIVCLCLKVGEEEKISVNLQSYEIVYALPRIYRVQLHGLA